MTKMKSEQMEDSLHQKLCFLNSNMAMVLFVYISKRDPRPAPSTIAQQCKVRECVWKRLLPIQILPRVYRQVRSIFVLNNSGIQLDDTRFQAAFLARLDLL